MGDEAQQQAPQQAPAVRVKPRRVDVEMDGREILAVVAAVAVAPRCPDCGGPAELRPSSRGAFDVHIEHRKGCKGLDEV